MRKMSTYHHPPVSQLAQRVDSDTQNKSCTRWTMAGMVQVSAVRFLNASVTEAEGLVLSKTGFL